MGVPMSAHRSRRLDRRTAEQLLRGAPAQPRGADRDALVDLLAAAAAPAHEGELAGEQAAVAAYRAARPAPVHPRRHLVLKTTLTHLLTAKIAAAAAALAVGGVAVAAATGHLSTHGRGTAATIEPTTSRVTAASRAAGRASGAFAPARPTSHNGEGGAPPQSLVGLCHAYTAEADADHGKALDSPAFTVLITTAGGPDEVAAYCTTLLAGESSRTTSADPTGKPSSHPTGAGHGNQTHRADAPPTHPNH